MMSMIPGMSAEMMPPGGEQVPQTRIKRYLTLMDSMTDKGSPAFSTISCATLL